MEKIVRSSEKKLLSRSTQNVDYQKSNQKMGKQKSQIINNYNSINSSNSINVSSKPQLQSQSKSSLLQFNQTSKKPQSLQQSKLLSQKQSNLFYSQLHIETHDKDVPLVRILKVNQQLQNQFVYYSTMIQKTMQVGRIRALNKGWRQLANHWVQKQRIQLKVKKLSASINKIKRKKLEEALLKLSVQKNKQKIKQKALIVINRLIISKINCNYRYFLKNLSQKKLIKIVLDKVEEDELIKIKMNLQIFKQITFSKQFITKCRPLIKYNANNKSSFQNQLIRQNFQQNLRLQIQRYQKIRQNVDNRNPNLDSSINKEDKNQSTSKKPTANIIKRKQTSTKQAQFYENQIVLMAIKSFNLSLIDTKNLYQGKILSLNQSIKQLQSQERYVQLQNLLKQSDSSNKAYENLINQFYGKSDEEIKKILNQIPESKGYQVINSKLVTILSSQKSKYQKNWQRIQKASNKRNIDQFLSKLYQSRCFHLDLSIKLSDYNNQTKTDPNIHERLYNFIIKNLNQIVEIYENEMKLRQFSQRIKGSRVVQEQKGQNMILISVSQCFRGLNNRIKQLIQQNSKRAISQKKEQTKQSTNKKSIQKIERNSSQKKIIERGTSAKKTSLVVINEEQPANKSGNLPSNPSQQQLSSLIATFSQLFTNSILQYIQQVNSSYQNNSFSKYNIENPFLNKNLLPQSKSKTNTSLNVSNNIQMNQFVISVNSDVIKLVKNFKQTVQNQNIYQTQKQQIVQMIYLFYQLILSSNNQTTSSSNNQGKQYSSATKNYKEQKVLSNTSLKYNELNKKWLNFTKAKLSQSNSQSQNYQQSISLVNTFNQILILFKQTSSRNKLPQQDFTQQLKKILKQKLQFQRSYHQSEKNLMLKSQQYILIQQQNRQYHKKHSQNQKQLSKLRQQYKNFNQKQQRSQQSIQRLKQELQIYVNNAKSQAEQNNSLKREINKLKSQVTSLNDEIQRQRNREKQKNRVMSKQKTQKNANKTTYTYKQYALMQSQFSSQITTFTQQIQSYQQNQTQLNNLLFSTKSQSNDLKRIIEQQKFNSKRLIQDLQHLKAENKKWIQIEETYQREIEKLRDCIKNMEIRLVQKQQLIEKYKSNQNNLQSNHEQKIFTIQQSKQQLRLREQEYRRRFVSLQQQIRKLNDMMRKKQEERKESEMEYLRKIKELRIRYENEQKKQKDVYELQVRKLEEEYKRQCTLFQHKISELHHHLTSLSHITTSQNSPTLPSSELLPSQHNHNQNINLQFKISQLFDPQKLIQSLKSYIATLQKQNNNLQTKYKLLKKQLYSDDASTTFSSKSHQLHNKQSISYYQKIIHDIKLQNDRLYSQIVEIASSDKKSNRPVSERLVDNQQINGIGNNVTEFWLSEIQRKQSTIIEQQKTIFQLKQQMSLFKQNIPASFLSHPPVLQNQHIKVQSEQIHQIQQKITTIKIQYQKKSQQYEHKIHSLGFQINKLTQENDKLKLKLQDQMEKSYLQSQNYVTFNYSQLLLSTKKVKQLFTDFIEATNSILYKLDRTSDLYLQLQQKINNRITQEYQKNQSQQAFQSILVLIQEFKTVIQNNHQTLKSIYQNLVCHPYTKNALELQYLKQLTFNILKPFLNVSEDTASLAKQFLIQQIQQILKNNKNKKYQKIRPIQEIFVNVQEFIVNKLNFSLSKYKKQLHIKALELDYIRQKFNLVIDKQLIEETQLISRLPLQNNYKQRILSRPFTQSNLNIYHNYQYEANDNKRKDANMIQKIDKGRDMIRPYSNQWVSKTSSNYQFKGAAQLDNRFADFEDRERENIRNEHVMFRSSVNKYEYELNGDQYGSER